MNRFLATTCITSLTLLSAAAYGEVRHEGTWPVELKHVTLDATHISRTEAVTRIAKEAGWSVVLRDIDDGKTMDAHITDQPADKVLDVVLSDGEFVARRDGTMITISGAPKAPTTTPATSASQGGSQPPKVPGALGGFFPAEPSASASSGSVALVPPMATTRGEDRMVHGGDLVVAADETVHDVAVFGGSVSVYGMVTGNVTVFGGSGYIKKGAHVLGSATAVGGSLDVADGAQVDGDVGVVGGSLDRHKGAKIGGAIHKNDDMHIGTSSSSGSRSLLREVSDATTRAAMLFVFGAVLFALAGQRMNALRVEAASRPMRAFALGVVGALVGVVSIALIGITVIGLPVAAVLLIGAIFAAYSGICAVLATAGKALVGHKTENPHIHLLVGCALFLVSGAIPFVSGFVTLAVVLMGVGVVVATRGAGMLVPNGGPNGSAAFAGPYRT